ncbi:MAG TPA: palindromic element RPE2 domain-containing protein [Rickettsia endosymbiont of Sericostoma sp.]|nr:palindromic element RPE2 domain-containing protein [Rickettsia endosymbiont of Sericostoma sp. HW-2014]HJD63819.1 palindromic element RPE2 domain-containing protein [Rickettsia endosymbiont of Sericostoma sp.]
MVNSGEFGTKNDGATPISNRRATSDDVTNFSSIDYTFKVSYLEPKSSSNFRQLRGKIISTFVRQNYCKNVS